MILACQANVFPQHIGAWLWVGPSASQDLSPTYLYISSPLLVLFLDVANGFEDLSSSETKR